MKSLWSTNIEQQEHKITPKEYLAGQISFLSKATNGKLQGALTTVTMSSAMDKLTRIDFDCELFIHSMKVNSPSLGYSFALLRLAHPTLKIYPFVVYSNLTDQKFSGNNIEDFEKALTQIFNSKEVVDAINSLSSQSEKSDELPF